jgi:hypothetical protein
MVGRIVCARGGGGLEIIGKKLVETLANGGCCLRRFRARGCERLDGSGTTYEGFSPWPPRFLLAGSAPRKQADLRPVMNMETEIAEDGT